MSESNKAISAFGLATPSVLVDLVLKVALLVTAISVFVPFSPAMPAASLDSSWVFGMNQAVAQGLSFGKELIFTFGPYASIYTKTYHPSTDFMMMGGSLYLAISYWASIIFLMRGVKWRWIVIFCAILAGVMDSRDALLFSYPLLVALTSFKIIHSEDRTWVASKYTLFIVALLFAPFGLLPLVKGSILILCGAITVLCSLFFIFSKRKSLAITCLASPVVSMLLFWVASGQSLVNLPNYFIEMTPIISGYTEAMATDGNTLEIIVSLAASAFLFVTLFVQKKISKASKIFLFCTFFVFLFLSFKGGFVRHDGHAILSGISLLLAALLLPFILNSTAILPVIVFSIISWSYINSPYIETSISHVFNNFTSTYLSAWQGLKNRITDRTWPRHDFDSAVHSLREKASFPVLQGTTDIYSSNQSYLIASGNSWSPRPIFQSYSVYTPMLAEENKKHLLGGQAPNNIIFKVEPIDERIPSIEDGASWPVLLGNYQPTTMENDFLFLLKKENSRETRAPLMLRSETRSFGARVDVPNTGKLVFAEIEIKPTLLGQLANIFFKPAQLQINLELKNGSKKQYRIIAGMAKSGFLVSPLIESTADFGLLYGSGSYLAEKAVKSFSIAPRGGKSSLWRDEYVVTFKQVNSPPPMDISKLYKFDGLVDDVSSYRVTAAEKCDGSIDAVNSTTPAPAQFSTSGLLRVNGWLANSADKATLPEAIFVVLTDNKGNHTFLKTRPTARPDVGAYFNKPEFNNSGYATNAGVSAFDGQYTLGLAIKKSDKIAICPQFKIPATIHKVDSHTER